MSEPRTLVGRYQLDERVGSGAMGEVWRATDLKTRQPVAVKLLHPHLATNSEHVRRFRREARIDLRSPHVVRLLSDGEDGQDRFLVMEYVEGETLAEELRRGALPPARAGQILRQVAEAMAEAHEQGIVHRDIKPGNILLTRDGAAKLADFGIARAAAATAFTQTGTFLGAFTYAAPEALAGHSNEQTDLYSLGVVLFEMLTGRVPFESDTPAGLMELHRHAPVPIADAVDADPALASIAAELLEKDPRDRTASALDLLEVLGDGGRSDATATRRMPRRRPRRRRVPARPLRLSIPRIRRWHVLAASAVSVVALATAISSVALTRGPSGASSSGALVSTPSAQAATAGEGAAPGPTVLVLPSGSAAPEGTIDRIEGLPETERTAEIDKLFGSVPLPDGAVEATEGLTRGLEFGTGAVPLDCPFRTFGEQEFSRWLLEKIYYEADLSLDATFEFYAGDIPGRWPLFKVQQFPSFSSGSIPASSILQPDSINVTSRRDNMVVNVRAKNKGFSIERCVVEPTPRDQWVPVQAVPKELQGAFDDVLPYPGAKPSYYEWGGDFCPLTKRSVEKTSYSISAPVDQIVSVLHVADSAWMDVDRSGWGPAGKLELVEWRPYGGDHSNHDG